MMKLISYSIVGFILSALGVYFIQLYVSMAAEGSSPLLIGLGALFIGIAIFCLVKGVLSFRAEKALATADLELVSSSPGSTTGEGGILNKNNELLKEWNKTNDARDKLKVLEAAGAAEEGN